MNMNMLPPAGYGGTSINSAWMIGKIEDLEITKAFLDKGVYTGNGLRKMFDYNEELEDFASSGNLYKMEKRDRDSYTKVLVSLERVKAGDFAVVMGIGVNNTTEYISGAFPDVWERLGMKEIDVPDAFSEKMNKHVKRIRDMYIEELVNYAIHNPHQKTQNVFQCQNIEMNQEMKNLEMWS